VAQKGHEAWLKLPEAEGVEKVAQGDLKNGSK
jgi:hypothetical protein